MMMNERARGRKEESLRRHHSRDHSFSFTACFFATLACLIQLPNSIEAGWKSNRDGTACTNAISTGSYTSYESECAGKTWEHRNIWWGTKENYYYTYGSCSRTCGGGTTARYKKYDYYRITSCSTKDNRIASCGFVHETQEDSHKARILYLVILIRVLLHRHRRRHHRCLRRRHHRREATVCRRLLLACKRYK